MIYYIFYGNDYELDHILNKIERNNKNIIVDNVEEDAQAKNKNLVLIGLSKFKEYREYINENTVAYAIIDYAVREGFHNAKRRLLKEGIIFKSVTSYGLGIKKNIKCNQINLNIREEMKTCRILLKDSKALTYRLEDLRSR